MNITTIHAVSRHRNGICGAPFRVVLFDDAGPDGSRKVAVLFDAPYHCAVLSVPELSEGNVAFGSNSWRGDRYEPALRVAIARADRAEGGQ